MTELETYKRALQKISEYGIKPTGEAELQRIKRLKSIADKALFIADAGRSSSLKEPDFRTEKGEWLIWNMLEYGNTIDVACQLLRQKEIVGGF